MLADCSMRDVQLGMLVVLQAIVVAYALVYPQAALDTDIVDGPCWVAGGLCWVWLTYAVGLAAQLPVTMMWHEQLVHGTPSARFSTMTVSLACSLALLVCTVAITPVRTVESPAAHEAFWMTMCFPAAMAVAYVVTERAENARSAAAQE
jgi:hypothetical protein